jgi:hypothetical protein
MSKKREGRDYSPSKSTCRCLSVLARLRWEREAKLSLWAEFSPFPSWHRKYTIEKNIRCSKRDMSEKCEGIEI